MRQTSVANTNAAAIGLPRGWVILGSALASWAILASVWFGATQMFSFLMASIG
ncbi:hypothetical protein [Devosia sp. 2618]|uniref:hypothetical protein n=1 Tax=Devosia sp. 2618 TaxID=3156454 RepID=UPI003398EA7B